MPVGKVKNKAGPEQGVGFYFTGRLKRLADKAG